MEKKKLLLVAVSVGVFLVIAISASILIFTPKQSGGEGRAAARVNSGTIVTAPRPIPAGTGARGMDSGASPEPEPAPAQPKSADVVDMVRNADGLPGLQTPPPSVEHGENTGGVSIDVRPRTAAGVPAPTSTVPKAAPVSPPAATTPAVKPAAVAAKPPAAKPAAPKPAASPARANNDYWVQIGAFSAQVRAEGVKETLAEKGITTIIDDRDVEGKTMYRVRVGPYTSETEASYWLALVKSIDGFSESQIRASARR